MSPTDTTRLRKRLMSEASSPPARRPGEIDIANSATLVYSSENPDHPVEHLIDGQCGRGSTRWTSARPNETERIVLEFDRPQRISCLVYEVEECLQERTQEVRVEVSTDNGRSHRQVLVQEYVFSPQGATFQHEELRLDLPAITHLSLTIVPNKSGSGVASLTSLRLFA
ncbi:MAG: discoidin domain-containing protein [Steroidobacteraceae bacterium]